MSDPRDNDCNQDFLETIINEFSPDNPAGEKSKSSSLLYCRKGANQSIVRNMAQKQVHYHDSLDLHGMSVLEAEQAAGQFIAHCRSLGQQLILIIHGKGLHSHQPILKNAIHRYLRAHADIEAFGYANIQDGGTGAIYVLIS